METLPGADDGSAANRRKRVLVVEDDPIVGRVYRTALEKAGFDVAVAIDGVDGAFQMTQFDPDAVVLDLMLPLMSGIEALKKMREMRDGKHLPIIVCTNAHVTPMISRATQAGATMVLNKASTTPRALVDTIQVAIAGNIN